MAYTGKKLSNEITGQEIFFLHTAKETSGRFLEMSSCWQPGSTEPVMHYHPLQSEDFEITSGELTVRLNRKTYILKKGDRLHIPPYTNHAMWNASDEPASAHWRVSPALQTEYFFETAMGLAQESKRTKKGHLPFLQTVLLAKKFDREFRLSKPTYIVQEIFFYLLAPWALLRGYRPVYKKYID